jgi:hypothetical protein
MNMTAEQLRDFLDNLLMASQTANKLLGLPSLVESTVPLRAYSGGTEQLLVTFGGKTFGISVAELSDKENARSHSGDHSRSPCEQLTRG